MSRIFDEKTNQQSERNYHFSEFFFQIIKLRGT